jgi:hypothetical protein
MAGSRTTGSSSLKTTGACRHLPSTPDSRLGPSIRHTTASTHQLTCNATQRHTSRLKDGSRIRVVQASWMETSVAVYSDAGTSPPHTGHSSCKQRERPNERTSEETYRARMFLPARRLHDEHRSDQGERGQGHAAQLARSQTWYLSSVFSRTCRSSARTQHLRQEGARANASAFCVALLSVGGVKTSC